VSYIVYSVSPLAHMMATDAPSLFTAQGFSPWTLNGRVDKKSFMKRWGYSQDRWVGSGVPVLAITIYQKADGTRYTIFLTDEDACLKQDGATFSYITPMDTHTQAVFDINGNVVTFLGVPKGTPGGPVHQSDQYCVKVGNLKVGDKFILNDASYAPDYHANYQPDPAWGTITDITSTLAWGDLWITSITLADDYAGTRVAGYQFIPGPPYGADCIFRHVYSIEDGDMWSFTAAASVFCFMNAKVPVQFWDGTGYAQDLIMCHVSVDESVAVTATGTVRSGIGTSQAVAITESVSLSIA